MKSELISFFALYSCSCFYLIYRVYFDLLLLLRLIFDFLPLFLLHIFGPTQVSFIIHECKSKLAKDQNVEVCVILESPGGSASDYALAAEQLLRLRKQPNVTVTVLVDKVAASGKILCLQSAITSRAPQFVLMMD